TEVRRRVRQAHPSISFLRHLLQLHNHFLQRINHLPIYAKKLVAGMGNGISKVTATSSVDCFSVFNHNMQSVASIKCTVVVLQLFFEGCVPVEKLVYTVQEAVPRNYLSSTSRHKTNIPQLKSANNVVARCYFKDEKLSNTFMFKIYINMGMDQSEVRTEGQNDIPMHVVFTGSSYTILTVSGEADKVYSVIEKAT
ncbi:hypothetical protein C0J52_27913, partial [Blattella germanica]